MNKSVFSYVTYIRTEPEALWAALVTPEFMKKYWFGMHCESDWQVGSPWKLVFADGRVADQGEIVEVRAPARLVIRWRNEWKEEAKAEGYSLCTFEIEPAGDPGRPVSKLSVTHSMDRPESTLIQAVGGGWPKILSNLKSLLETGSLVLNSPRG